MQDLRTSDAQSLTQTGIAALRRGEWATAQRCFAELTASGGADADSWAFLALAREKLSDDAAAHVAADQALALSPSHLRALVIKADLLARGGALRESYGFYRTVLQIAGAAASLPEDLAEGVARARAMHRNLNGEIESHVLDAVARAGFSEAHSSGRVKDAIALMAGKKRVYPQQPHAFYFPGLPTVEFFPREQFPWLDELEVSTDAIEAELSNLLREDTAFAPYLDGSNAPTNMQGMIGSMEWSTCFLSKDGALTANAARCPRTMDALRNAPLPRIKGRSPYIMFSQLRPGAHIRPHTGGVNTRLVCHLPLIVPPKCYFRVGNEVRQWERGKAWLFDDTIEHEAKNDSVQPRVVLIFDVWRPELNEEERLLITALLEAIDSFSGRPVRWD